MASILKTMDESEVTEEMEETSDMSDEQVLHRAADIPRTRMRDTKKLDGEYYSSEEMKLAAAFSFVDPLLLKFVSWLWNENIFHTLAEVTFDDIDQRCAFIACDITTLCTGIPSPMHLHGWDRKKI